MRGLSALSAAVLLVVSACGGEVASTTPAPTNTTAPTTTMVASTVAPDAAPPQLTRDIAYSADTTLDVYAPGEQGPWPVVIIVPGYPQSKTEFVFLAEALASEGVVVFNINYTMSPPFLVAIDQVACAVRFARATAVEYGGDPSRIVLVGNSAGAAIGAVVGMSVDDFGGDCVVTDEAARVDALVGYEGSYDWAFIEIPLREEDPDVWAAINPYSSIGGNPGLVVRVINGDSVDDDDRVLVPVEVAVQFHQALLEAGYDAELTVLEGASHTLLPQGPYGPVPEAFAAFVQQVLVTARS